MVRARCSAKRRACYTALNSRAACPSPLVKYPSSQMILGRAAGAAALLSGLALVSCGGGGSGGGSPPPHAPPPLKPHPLPLAAPHEPGGLPEKLCHTRA